MKNWEELYDEKFGNLGTYRSDELNLLNFDASKLLKIKSFISTLLADTRAATLQEVRERIEGMIQSQKQKHDEAMPRNTLIAYHHDSCIRALADLLTSLDEGEK